MNYSLAVFLINKDVRAVVGTYEAEENSKKTVFKTLDQNIAIGDFALVPTDTRHKMTVVKIVDVDVDVDFDAPLPVNWIISVVDKGAHEKIVSQEKQAIQVVKSAELRKKRDELRDAMFKDHVETLKALDIAALDVPKDPQPPQS